VANRLVPIRGGTHGSFDGNEVLRANRVVREFLVKRGIVSRSSRSPPRNMPAGRKPSAAHAAE
jgi:hypothetical protein